MPNWCANRLEITASPEKITQLRQFFLGESLAHYPRAIKEGTQLFVAGCAGLFSTTEPVDYSPYPTLTAGDVPRPAVGNTAFTEWVKCLKAQVALDEAHSALLHQLWLDSGVSQIRWAEIPAAAKARITDMVEKQRYDWLGDIFTPNSRMTSEAWWNTRCENNDAQHGFQFDMLTLIPTQLDVEINGFNGRLLNGVSRGYDFYVNTYGIKWPTGYDLIIDDSAENFLVIDFDTPWCAPEPEVLKVLSRQYDCNLTHWYSEAGEGFCGYSRVEQGTVIEQDWDYLTWSDTEDDESGEVISPDWIIGNVRHYGG